jgi:hypothetical protein
MNDASTGVGGAPPGMQDNHQPGACGYWFSTEEV